MTTLQAAPVPAHELVYEPNELPKLRSNFGAFLDRDTVGWVRSTPRDTPIEEMRRRYEEDGYIWVKNVIPREDVFAMREAYFTHMQDTSILEPGTSPREGIFNSSEDPLMHHGMGGRDLPDAQFKVDKLVAAHSLPAYEEFLRHPALRGLVCEFMGWKNDVLVKRSLLRHNVPGGLSTGIHYDKIFLRGGDAYFLTAWVPIGDVPANGGGIMYLENSIPIGKAMEAEFDRRAAEKELTKEERINGFNANMAKDGQLSHDAGELSREIEANGVYGDGKKRRWISGNYEAGDVVFHDPYMIHGAAKNDDPNGRIKLSTDLRFYEDGSDLDARWMRSQWVPKDGL